MSQADPDVASLAASYSATARAYREFWAPALIPYSRRLLRGLPVASARLVLDLGSGVGALLPTLAGSTAPSATVVAVDRSEGMLRLAPSDFPRAVMNAQRLAFAPDTFDVAVMAFMLFHVPDPEAALAEVRRVLRPGGAAGAITWASEETTLPYAIWDEELTASGAGPDEPGFPDSSDRMDTPAKLQGLFERAGFVVGQADLVPFEYRTDPDRFMRGCIELGSTRRRLATLQPRGREECIARVRERVREVPAEEFADRGEVIVATARALA